MKLVPENMREPIGEDENDRTIRDDATFFPEVSQDDAIIDRRHRYFLAESD